MTDIDDLRERFMKTYDESKDQGELKEIMDDKFLKDEMQDLLTSVGVEVKSTWTKDELSEKMVSEDLYKKIEIEEEDIEKSSDVEAGEEKAFLDDILSPSKLLRSIALGDTTDMKKFWEDLQKEVEKGFKGFRISPQKYWEHVEEMWKERTRKLQKNIEELEDTNIPQEEVEKLNDLWQGFIKEMNLQLAEIPIELKLKKDNILDSIKDHSKKSRRVIANPSEDIKDLYPLWFDLVEDIREELEDARSFMEDREEMVYDTWDEFKEEFTDELTTMAVEYTSEMEEIEDMWSSISTDIEKRLTEGFEEHTYLYEAFWKEMGEDKPMMLKRFEELRAKIEKDYTSMIEKALDSVKEGYSEILAPHREEKEKEIKELKERIEELEEKLEEE